MNPLKLELLKMRHARCLVAMKEFCTESDRYNKEAKAIEQELEAAIAESAITKLPIGTGYHPPTPARRHQAQESELGLMDIMPTAVANDFQALQARINNLFPTWKKHPHFTHVEMVELQANSRLLFSLTPRSWSMLENYYQSDIPAAWLLKTWRPESRSRFVQGISDIIGCAEAWVKECKIRGVASGVEGSDK